jgi:hypothetical protein
VGADRCMPSNPREEEQAVMEPRRSHAGRREATSQEEDMRRICYENGLSLVLFGLFVLCVVGQSVAGHHHYNAERHAHQQPPVSYRAYLGTGHFLEALGENWESEFLQMAAYVLFTVFLRQKGSPESKPLEGQEAVDKDPRHSPAGPQAPWPVRRGGVWLTVYAHSLTIALFLLFVASFVLHAVGGVQAYNADQLVHGQAPESLVGYLRSSTFWFESLQNWQSEFLSLAVMIVLSVFLRQRGSPESKPVHHPYGETGRE